ncbi:NUDIX domain-containing protein [Rhizobium lentis]|uniref:ADP-ribose pyrophosphatase YjhB (NUDIX family) n=1 Tax=Rhizobium lentis TaxID=1138194 RepID=A0A7W8UP49_9HYPH|nr:NUDIX domain-containing protein [Rhizobium lentis]MBB5551013.1 ADP-ribose pyrophosphatase YjhB (NUDIX family) [Rhizobium lentis]MBB5561548.1 ADP-ribose pyrophosphatase YjhB (NUDIX family) [Rhizobium lentis]MBB5568132.1 ADP-ribose pyrophosphatase YjhB (NUDIX family) [Rhizobium lentis]
MTPSNRSRPSISRSLAVAGWPLRASPAAGERTLSGEWALPGGWIHIDEDADLEATARRVLKEKTAVGTPYLEQLQTTGSRTRRNRFPGAGRVRNAPGQQSAGQVRLKHIRSLALFDRTT